MRYAWDATGLRPAARSLDPHVLASLRCVVEGCTEPLQLRQRPRPHFVHPHPHPEGEVEALQAAAVLAAHLAATHGVTSTPVRYSEALRGVLLQPPSPTPAVLCWALTTRSLPELEEACAEAAGAGLRLVVVRSSRALGAPTALTTTPTPARLPLSELDAALIQRGLGCWWIRGDTSTPPTLVHPTLTLAELERVQSGRAASVEVIEEPLGLATLRRGVLVTPARVQFDAEREQARTQRDERAARAAARAADPAHQARMEQWRADCTLLQTRLEDEGALLPPCLTQFLRGQDELGVLPAWWKLRLFADRVWTHAGERQSLTSWYAATAALVPAEAPVSLEVVQLATASLLAALRTEGFLSYVGHLIPQSDVWVLADREPAPVLRDACSSRRGLRVALGPTGRPCVLDETNQVRWSVS